MGVLVLWVGALGQGLCDPAPGGQAPACSPFIGTFALRLQDLGGLRKGFWFIEFRAPNCWLCRVKSPTKPGGKLKVTYRREATYGMSHCQSE